MKIILTPRKPRNPFAALARFRRAGDHRPGAGTLRQQAGRSLRRELVSLKQHSP